MWKESALAALGLAVLSGIAWVFTAALCDAGGPSEALGYRPEARVQALTDAEARARKAGRAAKRAAKEVLSELHDIVQKELEDENSELSKLLLMERYKEAEQRAGEEAATDRSGEQ